MGEPNDTTGLNERTSPALGQSMSLGGDTEKLAARYAEWAERYDADVGDEEYGLPTSVLVTLDAAAEHEPWLTDRSITVLDAGCGTGRIGIVLAERGYGTIDGIDLSPEMVAVAETRGVYRELEGGIDLSRTPGDRWSGHGDLVIVGGVFTVGHLPPEALHQVAKLARPGGVLITSVRPGYFDTTDYGPVSDAFVAGDAADLLAHFEDLPYTADTHGLYYAYRIN